MQKKTIIVVFRVVITISLLAYVVFKAGLFTQPGREGLMTLVVSARVPFIVLSILMGPLLNFSSSIKWYMLLKSRKIQVGLWRLFLIYILHSHNMYLKSPDYMNFYLNYQEMQIIWQLHLDYC